MRAISLGSIVVGLLLAAAQAPALAEPATAAKPAAQVKQHAIVKKKPTRKPAAPKRGAAAKSSASSSPSTMAATVVPAVAVPGLFDARPAAGQGGDLAAQSGGAPKTGFNPYGFALAAGTYRCDLDRQVDIVQVAADMHSAILRWDKRDYTLQAVNARTGALRYEDLASGLVWLTIVGKSMLLDTRTGKQLANDCRS